MPAGRHDVRGSIYIILIITVNLIIIAIIMSVAPIAVSKMLPQGSHLMIVTSHSNFSIKLVQFHALT